MKIFFVQFFCVFLPPILESDVKWALGSTALNKASGCDRIPVELLKTLKDDAIKCCIQCVSKPGRPTSGHRTGKSQSTSQFPKRVVPKNVLTIGQLHSSAMPRARHPGMWSQVGLRKHHYEQSQWRWWNSSWAISNPERWCCESAALNMPANLENSAVATGLENVSFHSNSKERRCQRMFKLLHSFTHLTC